MRATSKRAGRRAAAAIATVVVAFGLGACRHRVAQQQGVGSGTMLGSWCTTHSGDDWCRSNCTWRDGFFIGCDETAPPIPGVLPATTPTFTPRRDRRGKIIPTPTPVPTATPEVVRAIFVAPGDNAGALIVAMPDRASRCRYLLGLRAGVDDRSKQASDALDAALAFYRGPGLIKDGATGRHLDAMASASTQLLDVQRLGVASATNAMAAVDPGAPCLPR